MGNCLSSSPSSAAAAAASDPAAAEKEPSTTSKTNKEESGNTTTKKADDLVRASHVTASRDPKTGLEVLGAENDRNTLEDMDYGSPSTLQEELNEMLEAVYALISEDDIQSYQKYLEGIQKQQIAEQAAKALSPAPDFDLIDQDGERCTLEKLCKKGPVVLQFYRGKVRTVGSLDLNPRSCGCGSSSFQLFLGFFTVVSSLQCWFDGLQQVFPTNATTRCYLCRRLTHVTRWIPIPGHQTRFAIPRALRLWQHRRTTIQCHVRRARRDPTNLYQLGTRCCHGQWG